jgi:hypothetical protein
VQHRYKHWFIFFYIHELPLHLVKKSLIFILLLITITATFIPCCLADNCCEEQITHTTNKNQKNEETCPPFFACTTCSVFVELAKPILLIQPIIEKQVHHERIVVFILPAYSASYWQPPRDC